MESRSDISSAVIVHPEETENVMSKGPKPLVELRANQDIESGELILSEQTISNVTTSIPEQVVAKRREGILDHYYCNGCASLLAVPQETPNKFQTPQIPIESESPPSTPTLSSNIFASQNKKETTQGNDSTGAREFLFCRPNHLVPTCSTACRMLSEDFDNGICQTTIEQSLRYDHFVHPKARSMTHRKAQCLRDLILLRHITVAINLGDNPLNSNDLMFAMSGPNMRNAANDEVEPWSYLSHVIRPLFYLHLLFDDTNTDQFLKLSQVDGWIIKTLIFKINKAMRISQGPRYAKCFRHDGTLDTAFGPWDKRWDTVTQLPKDPTHDNEPIWIASIDSLCNLIRIADPALGQSPNVAIIQREAVCVYAIKTDRVPAIKAGDPLLRAAHGPEAPALPVELYAPPSPVPMDDDDDVDLYGVAEPRSGDTTEFLEEFDEEEEVDGFEDVDGEPMEVDDEEELDAEDAAGEGGGAADGDEEGMGVQDFE